MTSRTTLLTVRAAAELLTDAGMDVSEETVRRWARRGRLAVVRSPGGLLRFQRSDVEALLVPSTKPAGAA